MAISPAQAGVARGAGLALATTVTVIFVCLIMTPIEPSKPVLFWHQWNIPKLVCLGVAIGAVGNQRFYSPADIDGAGLTKGTPQCKVRQAILQNTLEQVVLAVGVHGAWAAIMPVGYQSVMAAASILFAVGRVTFAWGYTRGAGGRACGFGLTFYPTMIMLGMMCIYVVFAGLAMPEDIGGM